ncbi:MAG: hypothetical protein IT308_11115 [Anaerolineaceae bacterium]|nr:hypothetical protein [Anaerolineaceae bacterium]
MRSKTFALISLLVLTSMLLTACQPAVPETPTEVVPTIKSIRLNLGPGDVPTLDPSLATDTSSIQVLWEIMMGLTRQDEVTNEVQPAIATKWDISEDGKTYTFHLRDDISWVKYDAVKDEVVQVMDCQETPAPRMVTANDFYYGMIRTLEPATGSNYAYVLAFAIEGASAFNNGALVDPKTFEAVSLIELEDGNQARIFTDSAGVVSLKEVKTGATVEFVDEASGNMFKLDKDGAVVISSLSEATAEPTEQATANPTEKATANPTTEPTLPAPVVKMVYKDSAGNAISDITKYEGEPVAVTAPSESVGVKVIDDYTLEINFVEPAAYNAAIAGMWVAYPEPSWLIDGDDCVEAQGDRWTETGFNQGFGPYALKEWVHDSFITVVKNPFWPADVASVPQPKIEEVTWTMLDETAAFAEYETGNTDATAVPLADMDRVKADPELSKQLKIAPNLCTYYYGFNTKAPIVDDVRVRRALSMAIDRQALIDNVLKGEQVPAQWFSRPGLAGAPTLDDHPDLGIKTDIEGAKKELQSYLDEKGVTADSLDLTLLFNTSSGHQKIAEAIQQMWKDNLGVTVKLVNQEWAVFLETVRSDKTPQIWRMGWCPDYADANNFIRDVFAPDGSSNPDKNSDGTPDGGINWKDDKFTQLLLDAAKELDPVKRVDIYAQAEEMLVFEEAAIAPIYWYTRVTVTKPYVTRTFGSAGQESVDKWDIDMAAKAQ